MALNASDQREFRNAIIDAIHIEALQIEPVAERQNESPYFVARYFTPTPAM
jgi:hypothetical protein